MRAEYENETPHLNATKSEASAGFNPEGSTTQLLGGADVICANDADFYDPTTAVFLSKAGIAVMNGIALIQRLRS